jgi:hypothetical protein
MIEECKHRKDAVNVWLKSLPACNLTQPLHRSNKKTPKQRNMKKFIATLGLSALVLGAFAQDNTKAVGGSGPMITLDKEVHDYGTIDQGANGTCEFKVTNTGDQPLIISNCKGSCGCTVPKCDTAPIAPGTSSIITVKYDSNRVGPINKSVTISSNAMNAPEKIVRIKGEITAVATPAPTSPVKENTMAPTSN